MHAIILYVPIAGVGVSPPPFDLGIDSTPVKTVNVTPQSQVFSIQKAPSPIPFDIASPIHPVPSSAIKPFSSKSSTMRLAQNTVLDYIHVLDEGGDPTCKVLYGQQINTKFKKISVQPKAVVSVPFRRTCQEHPLCDADAIEWLALLCKNASVDKLAWYVMLNLFNVSFFVPTSCVICTLNMWLL